jgi:hypothetical protein
MCAANVRAQFGKATYDFQVVTLQAAALMAFNDAAGEKPSTCCGARSEPAVWFAGPLSFETLQEKLKVDPEVLKRIMHSLSCGKVSMLFVVLCQDPVKPCIGVDSTGEEGAGVEQYSDN